MDFVGPEGIEPTTHGFSVHTKSEYLLRKKPSTQQDYTSRIDAVIIPKLGKIPAQELTPPLIRKTLTEIGKDKPVHANRVQSILSIIYEHGISQGYVEFNPVKGIKKYKEEIDEHQYNHDEIKLIWKAIELEGEPNKSLMKLLLLTGQRLGETSRMKWSDLNGDEWIIPSAETKSGRSHIVPLGPMARGVINSMKMISGSSDFVFESQATPGQPIQYLQKTKKRIAAKSNVSNFKIHHLRRIVATEMIKAKIDVTHVGRVLNHSQLAMSNTVTAKHYIKHEYKEEKREALLKWEEILVRIIS
jgi:integrase